MQLNIRPIFKFITFQIGWIICVYFHSWQAGILGIGLAVFHIAYSPSISFVKEGLIVLLLASLGFLNDFVMFGFKVFQPNNIRFYDVLWLFALWCLFLSTFSEFRQTFTKLSWYGFSVVGGMGGALSYYAGYKIGAISYYYSISTTLIVHFINWAILFPAIIKLYQSLVKRSES